MNEHPSAHWFWKLQSVVVGLVGLYLVFLPVQCAYLIAVKHMRVFFPLVGYPISFLLGVYLLQTPYLVFRKYGVRARIQMWLGTAVAVPIIGLFLAPMFL